MLARKQELQDQRAVIQRRADVEIAAIQDRIDTLVEIEDALNKDSSLETLYTKARSLDLGLSQEK